MECDICGTRLTVNDEFYRRAVADVDPDRGFMDRCERCEVQRLIHGLAAVREAFTAARNLRRRRRGRGRLMRNPVDIEGPTPLEQLARRYMAPAAARESLSRHAAEQEAEALPPQAPPKFAERPHASPCGCPSCRSWAANIVRGQPDPAPSPAWMDRPRPHTRPQEGLPEFGGVCACPECCTWAQTIVRVPVGALKRFAWEQADQPPSRWQIYLAKTGGLSKEDLAFAGAVVTETIATMDPNDRWSRPSSGRLQQQPAKRRTWSTRPGRRQLERKVQK